MFTAGGNHLKKEALMNALKILAYGVQILFIVILLLNTGKLIRGAKTQERAPKKDVLAAMLSFVAVFVFGVFLKTL